MRATGNSADGARLRALIVVLWRAGLRISEALDLAETDLDRTRGALIVRRGKGGRRREVGMDRWALGSVDPVPGGSRHPAGRGAVLRDPRPNRREALGGLCGSQTAASHSGSGGRPPAVRASSVEAFARYRARARGRAAGDYPAPARALQFGGHQAGSGRGAVPALPPVRFPDPPAEPDLPIPEHPALHRTRGGRS